MFTIKKPALMQKKIALLKAKGKKIGFVPTMGYLHEGHLSLVRKARKENDIVVVSIFVNPKQFGPKEDFKKYPRDEKRDKKLLKKEGADFLFMPDNKDIYDAGHSVYVIEEKYSNILCGKFREGHFKGVLTIVLKLFNIVNPDTAYFGQKDFQQAFLIKKMVKDLNIPVKISVCPIVREKSGLAMSSRNTYLNEEEYEKALSLNKSLDMVIKEAKKGEKRVNILKRKGANYLKKHIDKLDYFEIVEEENLNFPKKLFKGKKYVVLCAGYVGKARLIDNKIFKL